MTDEDRLAVRRMLESHNTLTLATCNDGRPWAASLFFASDGALNLYFVSDGLTRHARDIAASPDVVATVNADTSRWTDVRGLQIEGRATIVEGIARANALRHYLAKFADVRALLEAPRGGDETTIGERLKAADIYRVEPRWIRLIDNSRGFGYKLELHVDESASRP